MKFYVAYTESYWDSAKKIIGIFTTPNEAESALIGTEGRKIIERWNTLSDDRSPEKKITVKKPCEKTHKAESQIIYALCVNGTIRKVFQNPQQARECFCAIQPWDLGTFCLQMWDGTHLLMESTKINTYKVDLE